MCSKQIVYILDLVENEKNEGGNGRNAAREYARAAQIEKQKYMLEEKKSPGGTNGEIE